MPNVFSRQLPSLIEQLNNYADLANSSKTMSDYNMYVEKHNTLLDKFSSVKSDAERIINAKQVIVSEADIPNPKDKNQWLSGGDLLNEASAGGFMWSPTRLAEQTMSKRGTDKNSLLMNGDILPYLGYGFGELTKVINRFYEYDSLFDDISRSVSVYRVKIVVSHGNSIVFERTSDDLSFGEGINSSIKQNKYNNALTNLDQISKAWNNRRDIRSLLSTNPMTITLNIIDVLTSEEVSVETSLTGAVLGTVYGTFKGLAMRGIAQLSNVTSFSLPAMIGFGLVGAVMDELAEMALGLDNHFGFGGEYLGEVGGISQFSEPQGFLDGLKDLAGDFLESVTMGAFDYKSAYDIQLEQVQMAQEFTFDPTSISGISSGYGSGIEGYSGASLSSSIDALNNQLSTFSSFKEKEAELGLSGATEDKRVTGGAWGSVEEAMGAYGIGDDGYEGNDY